MTIRRITFYSRNSCHLCDSAWYVLHRAVAGRGNLHIERIDVDSDPDLVRRYSDHVPVILLDGIEIARHRLDEDELLSRLAEP